MDFFKDQMDYIYFFYGLAFMLLAAVCFVLGKEKEQRLPWVWLGLFGISHGVHEWMDLITFSFGSSPTAGIIHAALLIISFVCLFEFGRAGNVSLSGHGPGRWVYLPLLALTALGGFAGLQGIYASSRYVFGITGGILSAFVLYRTSAISGPDSRKWLRAGSFCIGLYTLFAGIIVSHASFFPASLLNDEVFLNMTGTPVQLIRGLLAIFSAISIWAYSQSTGSGVKVTNNKRKRRTFLPVAILVSIIIIGWIMTQIVGNYAKQEDINESNLYTSSLADHLTHLLEDARHIAAKRAANPVVAKALLTRDHNDIEQARSVMDLCSDNIDCDSTVCYLLDSTGNTLISCHQGKQKSLRQKVTKYFLKSSLSGKSADYYAFEAPGNPVYFGSSPIMSKEGKLLGMVVIKQDLYEFEATMNKYHYCFLVDPAGTIFLSTREDMRLKSLWPPGKNGLLRSSSNGYPGKDYLTPVFSREIFDGTNESLGGERLLATRWIINPEGWSILLLNPIGNMRTYRLFSIFTIFVFCSLVIVFFVVMYFKDEAAAQLETTVRRRTAELSDTNKLLQAEILERMQAEEALRQAIKEAKEERNKFQAIISALGNGVSIQDTDFNILYQNDVHKSLVGDHSGNMCYRAFHNRDEVCPDCPVKMSFMDGRIHRMEKTSMINNRLVVVEITASPLRDSSGKIIAGIELVTDISKRKRNEAEIRATNAKLHSLLQAIPEMVYFKDLEGRHLVVNRAVEEFTGMKDSDLIGRTQADLPPDLAADCGTSDKEALETRREVRFEEQAMSASGRTVYLDTIKAPIFDSEGNLAGTVGVSRDITERKQMEAALRDSEERFRTLFDMASDGILLMEPSKNGEAVIVDANISIGEMHGFKREELIGRPITFLNAPGCRGQSPEMVKRLLNGEHITFEIDHIRKNGLVFPVEVSAKLVQLGGAPYILALDRDITGRKETEEQMKNYTRELEKYAGDLARSNRDLKIAEEELRRYREHLEDLIRDRTTALIKTNENLQQEISERKRAEETLKDSELRYRKLSMEFNTLFNSIPDALMLLSPELKIVWANESAAHILGKKVSGLTGRRCHELWHNNPVPCDKCPAIRSFQSGKTESSQSTTHDGRFWNVRAFPTRGDDGEISNVIVLTGDITEKITLQAEAIRAGQLASIGELAAGVAHEINNPVNSIINYAQVILDEEDTDVSAKIIKDDIAGRIIKEGGRIAGIIKSLLSFARDRKEEKQQADVHLILQDSLTLVEAQMRKDGVKLRVEMPADLPEIFCHSQQIQQVFLNVINNARYALNQKYKGPDNGKRFEIYAEGITVDLRPYVRIRFNDAGTGIPANIIDKIMNPFFSTKPSSKGTGLGLSISHGIISDHGGRFTIESIEGEFTNVIIDLPVMERT